MKFTMTLQLIERNGSIVGISFTNI